jgi:CheY-like chemotaxis protein
MTKILVVEDNEFNLELVTDLLEAKGFTVVAARDAPSGIQMALDEAPALILMDVSLPGMDGLEATRRLRADPTTAGIPIVVVTAHAMKGDEDLAREAGCSGYMSKPIDTRNFVSQIQGFLE